MSQAGIGMSCRSRAVLLLLLCAGARPALLSSQAPPLGDGVDLRPPAVPAAGRQVAELAVADFGRYAIAVASAQGTALQVIDRMSGGGDVAGEAGSRDGRIDLFLDRGTVRLVTVGSRLATGMATLSVTPFRERQPAAAGASAPQLVEGRPVHDELADFEQLSWWLEIRERRRVVFEAVGRNLADLRLWQNGSWLVDAAPVVSETEPEAGRPVRLCQLIADLSPGLYRLTAYGGPEIPWSKAGVERPFHLRFGWPQEPQALRERRTLSAFGFDRVRVPGRADFFRLELPQPPEGDRPVGLVLETLDENDPFATGGPTAYLTKESLPPVAEIHAEAQPERQFLVTVTGSAGQPYVLQHFARSRERELESRTTKSAYWVSTVHAGAVGDAIDPTAILVSTAAGKAGARNRNEVVAGQTVVLDRERGWARRFNLLSPATLFVEVRQAGAYGLVSRGVAAQFQLEPLFLDGAPQGYEPPPPRSAPAEWQLDPGYYRLTLVPVAAGIAEVELAPVGADAAPLVTFPSPRPSVQLGVVTLDSRSSYHLWASDQPGIEAGIVVRELPLDLAAALPVALSPGEELDLRVRAAARSRVRTVTEDGGGLEVALDGGEWRVSSGLEADALVVEPGEHRLRLRTPRDTTVLASVGLVSEAGLATTPLPEIPAATLAALPEFPRLSATSSQALDLAQAEARTFLVAADAPALYRIESTGLLATSGSLRTRTRANLLSQEANGIGRNFALAAYLREGDYQLTVRARGESAGHLGLELERAPIEEGGALAPGRPARATIDPRRAVGFDLEIERPGRYRFFAWGLRHDFPMRLEDAAGWPVGAPLAEGDFTVEMEPGRFRLIVLPQAVAARALVLVQREEALQELSGHGPHPLALGVESANLWLEPGEGEARAPDLWRFTLAAPTVATIVLSDEMQGELRRRDPSPGDAPPSLVPPGRGFRGPLAAGEYELAATSSRRNNRVRYRVAVRSEDLIDGTARRLNAPAELTLAVGTEAQVELTSFGHEDVRATLFTLAGERVAASDDRPGDWNFLLTERLAPGRYRLRVDPVGRSSASTEVAMRVPRERSAAAIAAGPEGVRERLEVGEEALIVPLLLPAGAEVVAVGALAAESLGLALEARRPGDGAAPSGWRSLVSTTGRAARIALPLAPATGELRLRIWSLDRRPSAVDLTAHAGPLAHRSEAELARGFDLPRLAGVEPPLAAAVVDLASPGCFRREAGGGESPVLLQAPGMGSTFEAAAPTLAPVGLALPLAAALDDGETSRVEARRARLGEGEALGLSLPARTPVVCDVADGGPAVVELEALGGEPMVGFLDARGGVGTPTASSLSSPGRVLTAKSAGRGRAVELWNAGETAVEARLSGRIAASPGSIGERLAWGSASAEVPAGGARLFELEPGEKQLRLALSVGTAALLLASGEEGAAGGTGAEALVWAAVEAETETLLTARRGLLVFADPDAPGVLSLEQLPRTNPSAGEASPSLAERERFEERFFSTGAFRLSVAGSAAGTARRLHLRGAGNAVFVGGDGRVERGRDFDLSSAGGSLRFTHGPGLVSAWIDADERAPGLKERVSPDMAESWGIDLAMPAAAARPVTLPAEVALDGNDLALAVELAAPALVKLRGTTPLAVAAAPGLATGAVRFEVFPEGARFDVVLPAGRSRFLLRGLAGEGLSGKVTLVAEDLVPLAEGLGTPALLAPGDSRGYAFRVARSGSIGLGVRADQGGVESVLFDASGAWMGRGVVQWLDLEAGAYVLVATAPPEGRPTLVRPALVGSEPPGSGPPPEEIRRFLTLASGEVPVPTGTAGSESLPVDWLGTRSGGEEAGEEDESYDPDTGPYDAAEEGEESGEGEDGEEGELMDDGDSGEDSESDPRGE
jgi:hypothetical protein